MKFHSFVVVVIALFCSLCIAPSLARRRKNGHPEARDIIVENQAGAKIDFFWVNPQTKQLADSNTDGGIVYGGEAGISSYVGHSFEVQELPPDRKHSNKSSRLCKYGPCRKTHFTVNKNEDQRFVVDKEFNVKHEDHKTKALEKARESLQGCEMDLQLPAIQAVEAFAACLEGKANETLSLHQEEINFQSDIRKEMGEKLVLYACQDPNLETTRAVHNKSWAYTKTDVYPVTRKKELVETLFESDHNSIHLVHNFLNEKECASMIKASAEDKVESNGMQTKTMNIHVKGVPLSAKENFFWVESTMHKIQSIAKMFLRADFQYTNDPMLTVYRKSVRPEFVVKDDDDESMECTMNEDGTCLQPAGAPAGVSAAAAAAAGGRIKKPMTLATDIDAQVLQSRKGDTAMLKVFCEVPEYGGGIHFPKAGVHVNAQTSAGKALFILFSDTKTGERESDPFVEQYVECPVEKGNMVEITDFFSVAYN